MCIHVHKPSVTCEALKKDDMIYTEFTVAYFRTSERICCTSCEGYVGIGLKNEG